LFDMLQYKIVMLRGNGESVGQVIFLSTSSALSVLAFSRVMLCGSSATSRLSV
jgi:hypothetical protein